MMNRKILLAAALGLLAICADTRAENDAGTIAPPRRVVHAQPTNTNGSTPNIVPSPNTSSSSVDSTPTPAPKKDEPRFDLDFSGGKLPEFLKAAAAALKAVSKEPLNVVVPTENADVEVPAVSLRGVTVSELFAALSTASSKSIMVRVGENNYSQYDYQWKFYPQSSKVWVFHLDAPGKLPLGAFQKPKSVVNVYQLTSYLARGLTVSDITTAILAAWKIGGIEPPPELKFHAETGLLLVAGSAEAIETVKNVLSGLSMFPNKESPSHCHFRGGSVWYSNAAGGFSCGLLACQRTAPRPHGPKQSPVIAGQLERCPTSLHRGGSDYGRDLASRPLAMRLLAAYVCSP